MLDRIRRHVQQSHLARNTLWMMGGFGARIVIQSVYFIVIARALGTDGLGAFIGVVSLVAILAPFSSVGSGNLLIKHVAVCPGRFNACWGNALVVTVASALLLTLLTLLLARWVLPTDSIPLMLVLAVALADLLFARLLDVSSQAFQAYERIQGTAQLQALLSLLRLVGAAMLLKSGHEITAADWAMVYMLASAAAGTVGIVAVSVRLGKPVLCLDMVFRDLRLGLFFAVSQCAQNAYNHLDKTMLVSMGSLHAAGVYGAAHRILDVAFAPVRSLLWAAYVRFFQHGADGIHGSLGFARKLVLFGAGYGVLTAMAVVLAAPLVPWVLDNEYAETVAALQWLALLPLLKVFHFFAADTLTGAGFQGQRTAAQVLTTAVSVALNLWLIPLFGWLGAAWSTLISQAFLAMLLWLLVWRQCSLADRTEAAAETGVRRG
jgi:O-antigen/teichoic acid export membrane protein